MNHSGERFGKTWCVLPWIHTATLTDGSLQLCCVSEGQSKENLNTATLQDYWNGKYLRSIRKEMLAGGTVKACRRCHQEEKSGYRSHRVIENKAWHDKLGEKKIDEIVARTEDSGYLNSGVISIDLRLGNTCNLQCIMCQPRESSKWVSAAAKLAELVDSAELSGEWERKSKIDVNLYEWYKNPQFWERFQALLPFIREIIVGGGEPLLIREHLNFIKACAESGEAKHIHVRYHTNLTIFPKDMIPYWQKFEKIEFFASIDGMDSIANYIRYPSDWSVIKENLRIIDGMGENTWLRFLCSVQALNILHIPQLLRWVRDQKFIKEKCFTGIQAFVHPGLVHWPQYLNPKVLPPALKEKITNEYAAVREEFAGDLFDKYEGVVNFMNSEDWSAKFPLLLDYLQALDKLRGTDSKTVFPELYS